MYESTRVFTGIAPSELSAVFFRSVDFIDRHLDAISSAILADLPHDPFFYLSWFYRFCFPDSGFLAGTHWWCFCGSSQSPEDHGDYPGSIHDSRIAAWILDAERHRADLGSAGSCCI